MPFFKLRDLTADDIPAVLAVQQYAPEAAQWSGDQYSAALVPPGTAGGFVVELENDLIGFLTYRIAVAGEAELLNMAVAPTCRRRGVAKLMLTGLRRRFTGDIFLEVRAANQAARDLYHGAGFEAIGRRKNYYSDPPDDAILMKCTAGRADKRRN